MAIQNIGTNLGSSDAVKLPILFRVGMSLNLYQDANYSVLSAVDFSHPRTTGERANVRDRGRLQGFLRLRGGTAGFDSEGYPRARIQGAAAPRMPRRP
jgi:hypothetical protein